MTQAETTNEKTTKAKTEAKKKPAAYIFGERPDLITAPVEFTSVTGAEVSMECTFVYRDREEFAAFLDLVSAMNVPDPKEGEAATFERLAKASNNVLADRVMQFLKGWPLDLEFNRANVLRLLREESAAFKALFEAYRTACDEGRRGNSKPQ